MNLEDLKSNLVSYGSCCTQIEADRICRRSAARAIELQGQYYWQIHNEIYGGLY